MPSIREYLLGESREEMPAWLKDWKLGDDVPLHDFLLSRIVFYPGAGLDGHAVSAFEGAAHCFVYADYGVDERTLECDLKGRGFRGYALVASYSVEREMVGQLERRKEYLDPAEVKRGMANWGQMGMSAKSPFMKLYIMERQEGFDEAHGPKRFAFLYMQMDAFAVYEALFANCNAYLWGMLLQDHGFGGNYDAFGRGGLLEKLAQRSGVYPTYILSADNTKIWDGYGSIAEVAVECGGMGSHPRRLYTRSDRKDDSLFGMASISCDESGVKRRRLEYEEVDHERVKEEGSFVLKSAPQLVLDVIDEELLKRPIFRRRKGAACRPKSVRKQSDNEPDYEVDAEPNAECHDSRRGGRHHIVQQPAWRSDADIEVIQQRIDHFRPVSGFVDTLRKYVRERCDSNPALLYRCCGVSRSVYSQLISHPDREVSKETVVALAFGMKLSLREAERFVRAAGLSFSRRRKDDCIYMACFQFGCYNTQQINLLLEKNEVKKRLPCYFE